MNVCRTPSSRLSLETDDDFETAIPDIGLVPLTTKYYTPRSTAELPGWRRNLGSSVSHMAIAPQRPYMVYSKAQWHSQPRYPRDMIIKNSSIPSFRRRMPMSMVKIQVTPTTGEIELNPRVESVPKTHLPPLRVRDNSSSHHNHASQTLSPDLKVAVTEPVQLHKSRPKPKRLVSDGLFSEPTVDRFFTFGTSTREFFTTEEEDIPVQEKVVFARFLKPVSAPERLHRRERGRRSIREAKQKELAVGKPEPEGIKEMPDVYTITVQAEEPEDEYIEDSYLQYSIDSDDFQSNPDRENDHLRIPNLYGSDATLSVTPLLDTPGEPIDDEDPIDGLPVLKPPAASEFELDPHVPELPKIVRNSIETQSSGSRTDRSGREGRLSEVSRDSQIESGRTETGASTKGIDGEKKMRRRTVDAIQRTPRSARKDETKCPPSGDSVTLPSSQTAIDSHENYPSDTSETAQEMEEENFEEVGVGMDYPEVKEPIIEERSDKEDSGLSELGEEPEQDEGSHPASPDSANFKERPSIAEGIDPEPVLFPITDEDSRSSENADPPTFFRSNTEDLPLKLMDLHPMESTESESRPTLVPEEAKPKPQKKIKKFRTKTSIRQQQGQKTQRKYSLNAAISYEKPSRKNTYGGTEVSPVIRIEAPELGVTASANPGSTENQTGAPVSYGRKPSEPGVRKSSQDSVRLSANVPKPGKKKITAFASAMAKSKKTNALTEMDRRFSKPEEKTQLSLDEEDQSVTNTASVPSSVWKKETYFNFPEVEQVDRVDVFVRQFSFSLLKVISNMQTAETSHKMTRVGISAAFLQSVKQKVLKGGYKKSKTRIPKMASDFTLARQNTIGSEVKLSKVGILRSPTFRPRASSITATVSKKKPMKSVTAISEQMRIVKTMKKKEKPPVSSDEEVSGESSEPEEDCTPVSSSRTEFELKHLSMLKNMAINLLSSKTKEAEVPAEIAVETVKEETSSEEEVLPPPPPPDVWFAGHHEDLNEDVDQILANIFTPFKQSQISAFTSVVSYHFRDPHAPKGIDVMEATEKEEMDVDNYRDELERRKFLEYMKMLTELKVNNQVRIDALEQVPDERLNPRELWEFFRSVYMKKKKRREVLQYRNGTQPATLRARPSFTFTNLETNYRQTRDGGVRYSEPLPIQMPRGSLGQYSGTGRMSATETDYRERVYCRLKQEKNLNKFALKSRRVHQASISSVMTD